MDQHRNVVAILNPSTGRASVDTVVGILEDAAGDCGVELTIERTRRPGHAVDISRRLSRDADIIVAVGGDGTVSDVVTGAVDSDTLIGIVPAGSTNMVAKDLGIPRSLRDAARIAMGQGHPQAIDVARAGDTTFIHMAGAGYDAAIMRDTSSAWKRRIGWVAYLPAAIRHARYPRFELQLVVDGNPDTISARVVLAALGSSIIHPRFKVGSGISRFDGMINVCVFDPPGLAATLSILAWIGVGHPQRSRWMTQFRGQSLRLASDQPVPFEIDGDYVGYLPVEITMIETKARVLVPHAIRNGR